MKGFLKVYLQSFSNLQNTVWVLAISMFVNRSGSMVLLFTSLYLTKVLHFSIAQAGFVMSFYGVGSIIGSFTGGTLTDKFNYKKIMIFSLLGSALVLLLMLWVRNIYAISIVIFLHALIADVFRPANSKAIAVSCTETNRTRSIALVRLAINLGFTVGPALGGIIAHHFNYYVLFIVDAFSTFLAAYYLWKYLPNEVVHVKDTKTSIETIKSKSAYKNYNFLFFIILVALYATCFFQIFASIPQFFRTINHYTDDTIGYLLGLNGLIVVALEMPFVARFEGRTNIFNYIILGVCCVAVALFILYFFPQNLFAAVIYTLIITFSEIFAMPFMMHHSLKVATKDRQGQYSALYSIAYGIGIILAPTLGLGIANKFGFNTMFLVIITTSLFTALGFMFLKKSN